MMWQKGNTVKMPEAHEFVILRRHTAGLKNDSLKSCLKFIHLTNNKRIFKIYCKKSGETIFPTVTEYFLNKHREPGMVLTLVFFLRSFDLG